MSQNKFYIAIIDDNPGAAKETQQKLATVLKMPIFENIHFISQNYPSGNDFLNSKQEYDLILMDYEMPGLNGVETAQKLQKRNLTTKIIFLSGYNQPLQH